MKKIDYTAKHEAQVLKKEIRILENKLDKAIRTAFPVGCIVSFYKGRGFIMAEILDHSVFSDRIKIRNKDSKKEYWIGIHYLLEK
jgi:hypothetical protein